MQSAEQVPHGVRATIQSRLSKVAAWSKRRFGHHDSVDLDALAAEHGLAPAERETLGLLSPACRERYARALGDGRRCLIETRLDREKHTSYVVGRAVKETARVGG